MPKIINYKKMFTLTAFAALSLTSLAGCGDDGSIKLGMWPEGTAPRDIAMYQEWREAFEADTNWKITPAYYFYQTESVGTDAIARTLPTVFQTWFTEPEMLISRGYIRDITPQLEELDWLDDMDESMKETITKDGRVYGVPRDGYGLGMAMNLEVLINLGLLEGEINESGIVTSVVLHDPVTGAPLYPDTYEELMEWSADIYELTENQKKGVVILTAFRNGGWQFSNHAWNFGADLQVIDEDSGKMIANLADPGAVAALEWIKEMKVKEYLADGTILNYQAWRQELGSGRAAFAFCGNDVLADVVNQDSLPIENLAFVPMPAGPQGDRYSLFGGTPFVFSSEASDDQVMGALRFLEYMGRSPLVSDISLKGLRDGATVARAKGQPILPTIKPWTNADYVAAATAIEEEFVNVDLAKFNDFYNTIGELRREEEPYFAQDMYRTLDSVLQQLFLDTQPALFDCAAALQTANAQFQNAYMNQL